LVKKGASEMFDTAGIVHMAEAFDRTIMVNDASR
jgi:hypothetical protein